MLTILAAVGSRGYQSRVAASLAGAVVETHAETG